VVCPCVSCGIAQILEVTRDGEVVRNIQPVERFCRSLFFQTRIARVDEHAHPWYSHRSVSMPLSIEGAGRDFHRNYAA